VVALHCFSRYCEKSGLHHREIDAFVEDLWEFPIVDHHRWDEWENHHPPLVNTALGDPWPSGFDEFLISREMNPIEFRRLLGDVADIVFSSFYGAADDLFSLACLSRVLQVTTDVGVVPPLLAVFEGSRFTDRGGWGKRTTIVERDTWRAV
jgi:hypothetical protein